MKCPRCQQENPPQAKFCLECGIRLSSAASTDGFRLQTQIDDLSRALTEAAEQQAATVEILSVISSSPNDVQSVFDTIVRNATRLCDAFDAVLALADGDEFVLRAPGSWRRPTSTNRNSSPTCRTSCEHRSTRSSASPKP